MIITHGPNRVVARRAPDGEIIAEARRSHKGSVWRVWLNTYAHSCRDGYRPPHVRINGQLLPEGMQRKLIHALLTES